jgi:hypothetical protein
LKKVIYNGIEFDSNLEVTCYKELKKARVKFDYHPTPIPLLPKIKTSFTSYEWGKTLRKVRVVREMTYEPDFTGDGFIIETKGLKRPAFLKKWNVLKRTLQAEGYDGKLFMPRNKKNILEMIEIIKNG